MKLYRYNKAIRLYYRENKIKLIIRRYKTPEGGCSRGSGRCIPASSRVWIYMYPHWTTEDFLSCAMHEACHVFCYREGKYKTYHSWTGSTRNKNVIKTIRHTALRAERYVDKRAERLMRKLFPKIRYKRSYRSKSDVEYLRNNLP